MDSTMMASSCEPQIAAIRPTPAAGILGRVAAWIRRQMKMSRDTARLTALDDHLLADMGLARGEIPTLVRHGRLPRGWTG